MEILVLNGSPRPGGNTAGLVEAFSRGARDAGHTVTVVPVCQKKIAGCLACEYCHTKGERSCIQQDDMQQIYPLLDRAEMLVLASPRYIIMALPDSCSAPSTAFMRWTVPPG